jgi:prolipoprotein diacylglyceryl transferase
MTLHWDPSREMFHWNLPLLGRPILWYGFLFALGFLLAYGVMFILIKDKVAHPRKILDHLSFYVVLGTVIGARLFDLIFYDNWHQIAKYPWSIIKVWEGGLASHGGVVGIVIALVWFQKRHRFCSFLHLLDLLVVPAGLVAFFIRIGNFVNQEILGKPTNVLWAVVFEHPANGSLPVARHPVQLYEAFFYLVVFGALFLLRNRLKNWKEGRVCGLFLALVFGVRFFIEFFKEEQSVHLISSYLTMGQWLSIPLVLSGLFLSLRRS